MAKPWRQKNPWTELTLQELGDAIIGEHDTPTWAEYLRAVLNARATQEAARPTAMATRWLVAATFALVLVDLGFRLADC